MFYAPFEIEIAIVAGVFALWTIAYKLGRIVSAIEWIAGHGLPHQTPPKQAQQSPPLPNQPPPNQPRPPMMFPGP